MVVLSPVLTDCSAVETTVHAIRQLISLLPSCNDEVKMLAADCLASLAHMRAGLPTTIVAAGGIDFLIQNLFTPNKPVSFVFFRIFDMEVLFSPCNFSEAVLAARNTMILSQSMKNEKLICFSFKSELMRFSLSRLFHSSPTVVRLCISMWWMEKTQGSFLQQFFFFDEIHHFYSHPAMKPAHWNSALI